MAEIKPKLKNRILLPDSEFYWESNNTKKKGGLISLSLSYGKDFLKKVLKCVHISFDKKSYTEVQIRRCFYTFMQNFRPLNIKV